MPTIETIYQGELRTKARHLHSGNEIITDAPLDNQGRAEAFSPTDLMAASLGSCMLTIMGIAARNHGFSIDDTRIEVTKIMADNPRRVKEVKVEFFMPPIDFDIRQRNILQRGAETCPVALSLHPDLKQEIIFHWH